MSGWHLASSQILGHFCPDFEKISPKSLEKSGKRRNRAARVQSASNGARTHNFLKVTKSKFHFPLHHRAFLSGLAPGYTTLLVPICPDWHPALPQNFDDSCPDWHLGSPTITQGPQTARVQSAPYIPIPMVQYDDIRRIPEFEKGYPNPDVRSADQEPRPRFDTKLPLPVSSVLIPAG